MALNQPRHAPAEGPVIADLPQNGLTPSAASEPGIHLNKDRSVAVGDYYFEWMSSCPLGVKVQLLTPHGIAIYGTVTEKTRGDYRGWAPVPRIREGM
jgi:hypothetical protein